MNPVQILLIEDQAGDILLTRHVLAEHLVPVKVHAAMDGQQAAGMLADPSFLADLIILDLNIPRISGGELLVQRKLRDVPVVVFSSLWSEANARRALELGASEYVSKPIDIDAYTHAVCGMIEKWATPNNNSEVNKAPA